LNRFYPKGGIEQFCELGVIFTKILNMKCPVCKDKDLLIADRQGVEIDYCPECRGIWLDRGELDKIFERTGESYSNSKSDHQKHDDDDDRKYYDKGQQGYPQYKKKKSIWGEIFDM